MSNPGTDGRSNDEGGGDALIDGAVETVQEAIPEGGFKEFLRQAGWGGLALGVLMGNVPASIAVTKVASRQGSLNIDAVEIYIRVFVFLTPWVVLFGVAAYLVASGNYPRMSIPAYLVWSAFLVSVAGYISVSLGGVVPVELAEGPEYGGPTGGAQYTATSLAGYVKAYGPLPPIAGAIEGLLFGYWIAQLEKRSP